MEYLNCFLALQGFEPPVFRFLSLKLNNADSLKMCLPNKRKIQSKLTSIAAYRRWIIF